MLFRSNTADNLFGIFTSRAMRERGKYQIQLMKTRSSSGVGQKIDLDFNIDSLRITDCLDPDDSDINNSSILNSIKQRTTIPNPSIPSSKLRSLLNDI